MQVTAFSKASLYMWALTEPLNVEYATLGVFNRLNAVQFITLAHMR